MSNYQTNQSGFRITPRHTILSRRSLELEVCIKKRTQRAISLVLFASSSSITASTRSMALVYCINIFQLKNRASRRLSQNVLRVGNWHRNRFLCTEVRSLCGAAVLQILWGRSNSVRIWLRGDHPLGQRRQRILWDLGTEGVAETERITLADVGVLSFIRSSIYRICLTGST